MAIGDSITGVPRTNPPIVLVLVLDPLPLQGVPTVAGETE